MGTWWGETRNLRLDYDGRLWLVVEDEPDEELQNRCLGRIETAIVDKRLWGELAELLDRWADAFDPREEALASYRLDCLPSSGSMVRPGFWIRAGT